ncbi:MAG TPA: VWA domain-containing protein [bacterium]|nr:VWA domain-containing protein [bacterium]
MAFALVAGGLLLAMFAAMRARTGATPRRVLGLFAALAFAVVAALADGTTAVSVARRRQSVELRADAVATGTAFAVAAAAAGPRCDEVEVDWQPTWHTAQAEPARAFGAVAHLPPALPFPPTALHVRGVAAAERDRPMAFEVWIDDLAHELAGELLVRDRAGERLRRPLRLTARPTRVAFTPVEAGAHRLQLEVAIDGHVLVARGGFTVMAPEGVLVVDPAGVVAAALRTQGERVRELAAWPADWRRHARIVLGVDLPRDEQRALAEAVHDGVGLFVLPAAFGDEASPLRDLLPVRPLPVEADPSAEASAGGRDPGGERPPASDASPPPPPAGGSTEGAGPISPEPIEVDKHSIAMVLVVDRSGSMGTRLPNGLTKMSYAKTSALRTAQALGEGDWVAVVTFGNRRDARVALPMTDASDGAAVRRGIERLAYGNEDTFLLAGLRRARALLAAVDAAVKHVVVISDGEFFLSQDVALRREASRMRRDEHITVSIVSIVDAGTDPGFKQKANEIARDGGGAFLAADRPDTVPVIVSSEVHRALSRVGRKPRSVGDGEVPVESPPAPDPEPEPEVEPEAAPEPSPPRRLPVYAVTDSPLLVPDPGTWPSLGRAVATEAPLAAQVLLVAGDEGWPLLAYANRGLGRVGAFAADLGSEAGREFRSASAFPAWIAQWIAAVRVPQADGEPASLLQDAEVAPAAPTPAEAAWLTALAGAPPDAPGADPREVPLVGRRVVATVSTVAPCLLLVLLALAVGERLLVSWSLRRGRET